MGLAGRNKQSNTINMERNSQCKNQNDKVTGLRAKISVADNEKKVFFSFKGKHSLGYDGCGTHTHGFNKSEESVH